MSKRNTMPDYDPVPSQQGGASKPSKKKKKKGSSLFGRIVRRFFLVFFTLIILILAAACLAANLIFNGPSTAARDILTMTLLEPSGTKWIPGLFMDAETLDSIRAREDSNLTDEFSDASDIVINKDTAISADTDGSISPPPRRISPPPFPAPGSTTKSRRKAPLPASTRVHSTITAPPTPLSARCRRDWFIPRASASGRPVLPQTTLRALLASIRTTSSWSPWTT